MKTIRLLGADYIRYMKDIDGSRHEVKKSLWDAYGVEFGGVRLTNPQGRIVGQMREDPGPAPERVENDDDEVSDATMLSQQESMQRMKNSGHVQRAPSPRSCKCASWPASEKDPVALDEKGRPMNHRRTCAFKGMWERQKGGKVKTVAAGPTFEASHRPAGKIKNHASATPSLMGKPGSAKKIKEPQTKVPHFSNCPKCSQFTKSKKMEQDQHHPTCEYYKKFKALSLARKSVGLGAPEPPKPDLKKNPVKLFDLEAEELVRDAEPEEIAEAREKLRDEGAAIIIIGEHDEAKSYLLMHEDGTSLEPAEAKVVESEGEHADPEPPPPDSEQSEDEQADQTGT